MSPPNPTSLSGVPALAAQPPTHASGTTPREAAIGARLAGRGLRVIRRRVMWGQVGLIAFVGVLHAVLTWSPEGTFQPTLTRTFDVDYEMNFPTWFASCQHLAVGLTLLVIGVVVRHDARRRGFAWLWSFGAAIALYLSADEIAAFHERLGGFLEAALRDLAPDSPLRAMLEFQSYYWVLVYAPVVVPITVGIIVFVWREFGASRRLALLGVFVFLYAAVGLDMIEGHFGTADHSNLLLVAGSRSLNFDIFLFEELLEMTGMAIVLHALFGYLGHRLDGLASEASSNR